MITTTAWRFIWKEYRHLRGFWIGLFAVTISIQLLLALISSLEDPATLNPFSVYASALLVASFYAFGCGATLFAHEHDESTFDLLRGMPIPWQGMLLGKSAVAAASTLLLVVFVTLTGKASIFALRAFGLPLTDVAWPQVSQIGSGLLIVVEALLWGTFWSLVSRRTLYAVVLAAASWLLCMMVINWQSAGAMEPTEPSLSWRISVVVALASLITAIASRWFDEGFLTRQWPARVLARSGMRPERPLSRRLTWAFWRMSRNYWIGLAVIVVFSPPILTLWDLPNHSLTESTWNALLATVLMSLAIAMACVPSLAGLATFQFDWHKRRYRFLSQLGVDPRKYWLSRQLSVIMLFAALAALATISVAITGVSEIDFDGPAEALVLFPLIALVTGQYAGMFCRSPIIAVFVAMAVAWLSLLWILPVGYLVESTWIWLALTCTVFPAMILATWVRASSWLTDSSRRRDWLLPLLIPVFVLALQFVGFVAYRVFEVPNIAVAADWDSYAAKVTPAGLATAEEYDTLAAQIAADPDNEGLLDEILRITSSPTCALHDLRDPALCADDYADGFEHSTNIHMSRVVTEYLLRRAENFSNTGELAKAWSCYEGALNIATHLYQLGLSVDLLHGFNVEQRVHRALVQWALLPNQEADLLRASEEHLHHLSDEQPALEQSIELQYLIGRETMSRSLVAKLMPWEWMRAARLNRLLTANQLHAADAMEDKLKSGSSMSAWQSHGDVHDGDAVAWMSRTLIGHDFYPVSMNSSYIWNKLLRQGTICALVVARYRVEQGSLPAALDQLSELPGYETVVDPTTGKPFEYRPTGMAVETRMWSRNNEAILNAPGTPLLWSEAFQVTLTNNATRNREWYGVGFPIGVVNVTEATR